MVGLKYGHPTQHYMINQIAQHGRQPSQHWVPGQTIAISVLGPKSS